MIERAARSRFHGTIRITIYGGEVRQLMIERSIVDPTDELARDESAPL